MALGDCGAVPGEDGRELKEHGSALFPVGGYYDDLRRDEVPWHWHEELEAAVVIEGEAELLVEKKRYLMKAGEGFFVNTGALHSVLPRGRENCHLHSLVFHPRLVGGSLESVFWQNYVNPLISQKSYTDALFDLSAPWHAEACGFIAQAWQAMSKEPPGYEFAVRSALSQLIFLLTLHQEPAKREPSERELRDAERIRAMLSYIQEHFGEEVSMAQIAGSAMISESECLRCFHKSIGMPPGRYLKQLRLQRAAELLLSSEKKIGDIGAECGFFDTSYFTKAFREMKGCTPGEYRKRLKNN